MGIKNRADLLLALLYAGVDPKGMQQPANPVIGITRLEKLLFLLKQETNLLSSVSSSETFNFVPFRMGPYTNEVYDEVDFLESFGLLRKREEAPRIAEDTAHNSAFLDDLDLDKYQRTSFTSDEKTESFELTSRGRTVAEKIWRALSTEERSQIVLVKRQFNNMNLRQFLRYVYKKYPKYTMESEIKDYLGLSGR